MNINIKVVLVHILKKIKFIKNQIQKNLNQLNFLKNKVTNNFYHKIILKQNIIMNKEIFI